MAARRIILPDYGTVSMKGTQYYRTRVTDQQGRRVTLYARTREELYQKEQEAIQQIENKTYRRSTPTVEEYCEKWLLMQSAQIRMTTDYTSKVKNYIIKPLGDMHMGNVTADDIRLALLAASKKSASVYKSVNVLYKCIFTAAMESKIIDENPTIYLKKNVGGIPQKDRLPLTDEQVDKLLDTIYGLPLYVFVMLGLYAGLRREEILGLQWDSVYLDCEAPYLTVRRAWHTEHNRPVILTELKTKAAHRNVPLPDNLLECLKEAKKTSTSDYVAANRDGAPLSYTQFKRLWQYIVTRTTKERCYYRYEDGKRVKHTVKPVLGQKAAHNGNVVYSLDFEVTPHQLRHTYITNLIHAFLISKASRYDIKGRKYIGANLKYYFTDLGLRNARLNFRQQEPTHIMENSVYNELLIRGYNVDVGVVQIFDKDKEGKRVRKQLEVDFVVNQGNQRYYIQVAYDMTSKEKQTQEFNSLRNIPDSFKKIVIVNGSKKPWRNDEGFVIMGMKYFLLNADSLEF